MERVFSMLILTIMSTVACKNSDNKPVTDHFAQMDFTETILNFGLIPNGSKQKCSFEFRNSSKAPLVITNVIATCGCTSPKWPKKLIPPGKNGIIEIQYSPAGVGLFSKSITVFSNAKNSPVHLYIRGEITL